MRRKARFLLAGIAGLVMSVGITGPAFAGKNVKAPITKSCSANQIMTSVQFEATDVPRWQRVSVSTQAGTLTREHSSYVGRTNTSGTARYDIAIDSPLSGQPAVAYIGDDAWNGTFKMTGATCKNPEPARVSGQGSACGNAPRITVQVANPNPRSVTYRVGGEVPTQTVDVPGGQSKELVFEPVSRGRDYQVQATGSDGTAGSTEVSVPLCPPQPPSSTPTEPDEPEETTQPTDGSTPPANVPGAPGVPESRVTNPGVPASVAPPTVQANASPAASASSSTAAPSVSASVSATFVPESVDNVDPFEPLLQAQGKTTILAAPAASAKELLNNNITLAIIAFVVILFGGAVLLSNRRRPRDQD